MLRLDKGCQEARDEIHKVRIIRIIEMGFTERQANSAISKYINVQVIEYYFGSGCYVMTFYVYILFSDL